VHKRLKVAEPPGADLAGYFGLTGGSDCVLNPDILLTACGLNYMWVEQLDQSQRVHGLTAEEVRTGLIVDLQDGASHYWAEARRLDSRFVADTERRERQLATACGPLKFTFSTADPDVLDHLIEHKRAQYRRTGVMDALGAPWRRRVLRRLAECRDPECTGVLSTLYAGSTWVASHFGLLGGRTLYFWFPVYNPVLRRYSPGRLLVKAIIDAAEESGIAAIDRCGGDTQAKRDFANAEHTFYRGSWRRPCLATLTYQVGCSIYWRMSGLRQLIRDRELQEQGRPHA
jgi:CelD/BcsL family acetyltransferase involved in cellulose biosynthesis